MLTTYNQRPMDTDTFPVKVCDEPHPVLIQDMLQYFIKGDIHKAYKIIAKLWRQGYAAEDIIGNVFRVCKRLEMDEKLKLVFIREIGETHMRIVDGMNSLLQLTGLLARLCQVTGNV